MQGKRMYKVISPIERKDGSGKYWLRCGSAFLNKDLSINVYIDALPLAGQKDGVTLQLREYTEDELRERAEKRASYQSRGALDAGGVVPPSAPVISDQIPF
jgi:hypothetical protein